MSYLVNERKIADATYTQALCALLFLYKKLLKIELPWIDGISRPKKPARRPTVLTRQEVELVLYGTGMRLMECAQLRVKDVDFQRREILVRQGKGGKDRITMLPLTLVAPLRDQIAQAKQLYEDDRLNKRNGVMLPDSRNAMGLVLGFPVRS